MFPTGSRQGTEESFNIPITDDQLVEGDETILLQASTSAPGDVPTQAPGQDRATVVIRDDDCECCSINILFIILIRGPIQFVSLFQYALLVWSLTPMRYKKAM